ncbi:MAG: hypothetical protein ACUVRD_00855 [Bacteroidia bacterium]
MMRHVKVAAVVLSVGLVTSLTACKKEKEQNGPSVTLEVRHDGMSHDRDFTLPLGTHRLIIRADFKKGTGKDDADLKSYNISYGGSYTIPGESGSATQGAAFTVTDTITVEALSASTLTVSVNVTDKNDETASKAIKITFQNPSTPAAEIVSGSFTVTNQSDGKGTYIVYTTSDALEAKDRAGAQNTPDRVLFVYYFSTNSNRHSVISPFILKSSIYDGTPVEWDDPDTKTAEWVELSSSDNYDTVQTEAGLQSLYNGGTPINDEFPSNGNERAELTPGRVLAFKWGGGARYGVVKVTSVDNQNKSAKIAIKVSK